MSLEGDITYIQTGLDKMQLGIGTYHMKRFLDHICLNTCSDRRTLIVQFEQFVLHYLKKEIGKIEKRYI